MSDTARYESCPVCHGTCDLPHAAHMAIVCAWCRRELGWKACKPESVGTVSHGLCVPMCQMAVDMLGPGMGSVVPLLVIVFWSILMP